MTFDTRQRSSTAARQLVVCCVLLSLCVACVSLPDPMPLESTSRAAPEPHPLEPPMKIVETDHVKLDKGDAVILHMRRRSDPNPFTPGGPFTAQHTIKAGEGGAVDGAQLVRAARAILKEESFEELRLLAPREGEDPQAYASAITVSEDESERFNAYVARDDQGAMHLFMEAQVQP